MKYRILVIISYLILVPVLAYSQVYFSDDFESGLAEWTVSGQDWDTTSASYSSSNHSVTDSPIGNYASNTDVRITMQNTLDLTSSTNPVLTFWQMFYTQGSYDFCIVEISDDSGFNWVELTRYTGGNRTWSHIQLDLSDHRASSVLIRFKLTSNSSTQTDGWYLDDVEIKELDSELTPFPFSDNFENGIDNWISSDLDWDTTSVRFSSSNYAITDSPLGNYSNYSNTHLVLEHPIDLSGTTQPVLAFWQNFYTQGSYDFCIVDISDDGGFNWVELTRYSGGNRTWSHIQLDLSEHKTSSVLIRFRLRANSSTAVEGWYLDDVEIKELDSELTPFPFSDNFENGIDNWISSDQDWDTTSTTYVSNNTSITDSPLGNYPNYSNTHLVLVHPIDLLNTTQPVITFWQRYDTQGSYDFCYLEISTDGGFNWQEISSYSGTNNAWHQEQFDLSDYKTSSVLIRFRLRSNSSTAADGWYLDDIEMFDLSGNRAPQIESFTAIPTLGAAPLNVSFEAQGSDTDGSITGYIWDFNGDGVNEDTSLTGLNNYIYSESGTFNATCRVTDDQGSLSSPSIIQINVYSNTARIISVPDDSASADATFNLPIQINNVAGIAGAEFRLDYDPIVLEVTNVGTTNLSSGFTITDSVSSGSVVISMARATGLTSGSGDFVNITFHVASDALAGQTSQLTLDQVSLYDVDTNPIESTTVNGLFTVKSGTVISDALKYIFIDPGLDTLKISQTALYRAYAVDSEDNIVEIDVTWSYENIFGTPGGISPSGGNSTVFTASGPGDGLIAAEYNFEDEIYTDTAYVIVGEMKGDINIDQEINVPDAILCLQIAAEILSPSPYQDWSADFNDNYFINSADAIGILTESLNNLLPKIVTPSGLSSNSSGPAVIFPAKSFTKTLELLSVSIFVDNRMDICGMDLRIDYNTADFTLTDISPCKSSTLLVKNPEQARLSAINLEGLANETGEIVTLHFEMNQPNVSDTDLKLSSVDLFDQNGNTIDTRIDLTHPDPVVIPSRYGLNQNFPNPFNPSTTITFDLPESGDVHLAVYNITGQIISSIIQENREAGTHSVTWRGRDNMGQQVSSGVYFYKIVFNHGQWSAVKKMLFVK